MRTWSIKQLLDALERLGARLICENEDKQQLFCSKEFNNVHIDTNKTTPLSIFIGIKGSRINGSAFASKAADLGAGVCIVNDVSYALEINSNCIGIVVSDTFEALKMLGQYGLKACTSNPCVIGITGSVGKTSTKELISHALTSYGTTHATAGNYNSEYGIAVVAANTPVNAKHVVLEMGMRGSGEIEVLSKYARPGIAVMTSIAAAHIEYLGSLEAIARAKAEIFVGLESPGIVVLDADSNHYSLLKEIAVNSGRCHKVLSISNYHSDGYAKIERVFPINYCSTVFEISIRGKKYECTIPFLGAHWAKLSGFALMIADILGYDLMNAINALRSAPHLEGRGKIRTILDGKSIFIDDSYNANPLSMRAAIETLQLICEQAQYRSFAVLGQMLELGVYARIMHEELAPLVSKLDFVVLIGENMAYLHVLVPHSYYFESYEDAKEFVLSNIASKDAVLIKGSNGSMVHNFRDEIV